MYKQDPESAGALADPIIKNTYRTLMTRGQKGCYIFCVDKETNEYFKKYVDYGTGENTVEDLWRNVAEPDPPGDS
jgi:DUF2075 family protein